MTTVASPRSLLRMLRVRIEVAESLATLQVRAPKFADAVSLASAARIDEVLEQLGIPARAVVTVGEFSGERSDQYLRIYVNDQCCRYSHQCVERIHANICGAASSPVDPTTLDNWLREALQEGPDVPRLVQFAAQLCELVVKISPEVLLGPEQLDHYRARLRSEGLLSDDDPIAKYLDPVLKAILANGISISDSQRICQAIRNLCAPKIAAAEIAEQVIASLPKRAVEIHVAASYLRAISATDGADGPSPFPLLRDELFYELGVRFPDFHFVPRDDLPPRTFAFKINDLTGAPWVGIAEDEVALNESPIRYLVRCLGRELRWAATRFVTLDVVTRELDRLAFGFPALVAAARSRWRDAQIVPALRMLLAEEISVRSLHQILMSLIDFDSVVTDANRLIVFDDRLPALKPPPPGDPAAFAASIRMALKRYISHKYTRGQSTLVVYLLDSALEQVLAAGYDEAQHEKILRAVHDEVGSYSSTRGTPVVLTTTEVRATLRTLLEKELPSVAVLAYQELSPDMNIQPIARISA